MKTSKKEIKNLLDAGKLKDLIQYVVTDTTKADLINALYLLFSKGGDQYHITFESLPYSRGGKYARHTSTLNSTQNWQVKKSEATENYYINTWSTSNSAACAPVIVPKFYTESGKNYHNGLINGQIERLKKQLLP